MTDSSAYEKWPAVRRLVDEAAANGLLAYQMLADLEYHARRHQLALTFHDAVELARVHQQRVEAQARDALASLGECPSCHPSGGDRYRRGEDIRQKEDGSLTCLACGRVVSSPESADVR